MSIYAQGNYNTRKGGIDMYSVIDYEDYADKLHNMIDKVYIVDTLKSYDIHKWEDLSIAERQKLVDWVDFIYYKQEMNISLGCICDSTMEHRKAVLSDKYDKWKFFNILANRWLS